MEFIIAQIIGIIGAIFAMLAAQMKEKKKYLICYAISYGFFVINLILLKAYAGAMNCVILTILTIISTKYEKKQFPIWLAIIFGILILIGNIKTYNNIFSLLPAVASYIYLFILLSKNMKIVRQSTVILRLLWTIYDFIVKAYTTFAVDIFSVISSLIAIYRVDIKKGNSEKTE